MDDKTLKPLRNIIDRIDSDIVELINQRLSIGKHIGLIKKENGIKIHNRKREDEVIDNLRKSNNGLADFNTLQYIFKTIIEATREIQKTKEICSVVDDDSQ